MNANQKRTVGFALKSRLPSVYDNREAVDAGGLMYYGADLADSYRRVAYFVDKILKGAKPADLPVEQPKKVPRIEYLSSFDPATESARAEAIRLALRERGYIEGQNIAIEYRYTEGKVDRFSELAAELVRLKDSSFLTMTLSIGRMGQG